MSKPASHQYLEANGWVRVGNVLTGFIRAAQWTHPRNGDRQYSTVTAEFNQIEHARREARRELLSRNFPREAN